ncbi:carboxypeptidase B-like protein, partial [Dinothrombium tinctorium]
SYENYKLVQITVGNKQEAIDLEKKFPESNETKLFLPAIVERPGSYLFSESSFEKLKQTKFRYNVLNENFQRTLDEEEQVTRMQNVYGRRILHTFPTHAAINEYIEELALQNQSLASVEVIGYSYENREMKIIKIGRGHKEGTKPIIWIDAGIHAREWATPVTALFIISSLLEDYSTDPITKALVDKYDWYILPSANPDGYEYTRVGDRLWRKTRSLQVGNCIGADPNRNWDFHWNEVGASYNPCSDTYAGPKAFSEKETSAMSNYIFRHKNLIKVYLTIHSYSQMILTPYGHSYFLPPNFREIMAKAKIMENAFYKTHGKRFRSGPPPYLLYPVGGGSYDWAHQVCGIPYAFAFELRPDQNSRNGFVLPVNQIQATGEETWAAVKSLAQSLE